MTIITIPENDLKSVTIKTNDDMQSASIVLGRLSTYLKQVTEEKEKVTKPLNEALKAERARFKPLEDKIGLAIAHIRGEVVRFKSLQLTEQSKVADKLRSGDVSSLDDAMAIVNVVGDKKIDGMSFRTQKVLKVTNASKIPRKYLVVDEKRVLEDLKKGVKVAGCSLEERVVPVVR